MAEYLNLTTMSYLGEGKYDIPRIKPIYNYNESDWKGFSKVLSHDVLENESVHFFNDDEHFERLWTCPKRYVPVLKQFKYVLSPDFSVYTDYPVALQIYNHYRKHWLGRYFQDNGIKVIPTIAWSDEQSFKWCFDGEPKNAIVAVSNVGCMKVKEAHRLFEIGYQEMLKQLTPKLVLVFGETIEDYGGNILHIKTESCLRRINDNNRV
jgi:hypothetical protein